MTTQNVDYTQPPSPALDTGGTDPASIRPILNGEPAIAAVANRPDENLRLRTEVVREELEQLKYVVDADRGYIVSGGGTMVWGGVTANGGTGIVEISGAQALVIRPFLSTPHSTQARAVIRGIVISTVADPLTIFGPVVIQPPRAYSGANKIEVEFTVANLPNSVTLKPGLPANKLLITVSASATINQLKTFLNASSSAAAVEFQRLGLVASSEDPLNDGNLVFTSAPNPAIDRKQLAGGVDAEQHVITQAGLINFFTNTANHLQEGDVLAIGYEDGFVGPVFGGRRQSVNDAPEGTTGFGTNVDLNLFILRRFPELLPIAIPVAAVADDQLRLVDGTILLKGVGTSLSGGFVKRIGDTMTGPLIIQTTDIKPAAVGTSNVGTATTPFAEMNALVGRFATLTTNGATGTLGNSTDLLRRFNAHLEDVIVYGAGGLQTAVDDRPLGDPAVGGNRWNLSASWISLRGDVASPSLHTDGIGTTHNIGAVTDATTRFGIFANSVDVLNLLTVRSKVVTDGNTRDIGEDDGTHPAGTRFNVFANTLGVKGLTTIGGNIVTDGATHDIGASGAANSFNVFAANLTVTGTTTLVAGAPILSGDIHTGGGGPFDLGQLGAANLRYKVFATTLNVLNASTFTGAMTVQGNILAGTGSQQIGVTGTVIADRFSLFANDINVLGNITPTTGPKNLGITGGAAGRFNIFANTLSIMSGIDVANTSKVTGNWEPVGSGQNIGVDAGNRWNVFAATLKASGSVTFSSSLNVVGNAQMGSLVVNGGAAVPIPSGGELGQVGGNRWKAALTDLNLSGFVTSSLNPGAGNNLGTASLKWLSAHVTDGRFYSLTSTVSNQGQLLSRNQQNNIVVNVTYDNNGNIDANHWNVASVATFPLASPNRVEITLDQPIDDHCTIIATVNSHPADNGKMISATATVNPAGTIITVQTRLLDHTVPFNVQAAPGNTQQALTLSTVSTIPLRTSVVAIGRPATPQ